MSGLVNGDAACTSELEAGKFSFHSNWTSRSIANSAHCKLGPWPRCPIQTGPIFNSAHTYKNCIGFDTEAYNYWLY